MENPDKTSRKALLNAWKEAERQKSRAEFPLNDTILESFFSGLETQLDRRECDHKINLSKSVIAELGLSSADADALLDWCNENGGFCDCEILGNTQDHWRECRARS